MSTAAAAVRRVAMMLDLDWPYDRHLGVLAGTQRYAEECGRWDCVVDELAPETLRAASGRRAAPYDGVVARATAALVAEAKRLRVPVVNTWFDSPAARDVPSVLPDFAAVGTIAAEHLLGLGLRRFACFSVRNSRANAATIEAFHAALREAGCACQCVAAPADYLVRHDRRQRLYRDLGRWIESWRPPVGVYVVIPDMSCRYIANECRKRGLRIPDEVALVAGVSEPVLCLHPPPSLTSIGVSYEEVGYQAAKLLDQLMDRKSPTAAAKASVFLPPIGVIARQSTNFLAIDDEVVRAALQFMTAPGNRRVSVGEVAAQVHTSRRTLERRFSATLGRTVAQQIRILRVERAKRHLADVSLPIKAVARLSGFPNAQRLYEAFRRHEGVSPAQFRASRGFRG